MSSDRPFKGNVTFTEEMANAARTRLREKLASLDDDETMCAAEVIKEDQPVSFDDEGEEMSIDDLLPFTLSEKDLIEQIGTTVRKRMASADPETLRKIAAFLFALERLPYSTPNVSLDLAIVERINENLAYVSVELDGQFFRLSSGGSVYSPYVGSDSFSETMFEIEAGGFREGSTSSFNDWLDAFVSAAGSIEIEGDIDFELTEPEANDGWSRLEKYWEFNGEDINDL